MTIIDTRVPADSRRDKRLMLRLGLIAFAFEGASKNLTAEGATFTYDGAGDLTEITYADGLIKTFAYSGGNLISITLSGATPLGIGMVKTLSYTGDDLTGITYS